MPNWFRNEIFMYFTTKKLLLKDKRHIRHGAGIRRQRQKVQTNYNTK